MILGTLGMVDMGGGMTQYLGNRNPLLMQGVKARNRDGSEVVLNPDTLIREDVAQAIADLVGGVVIEDPNADDYRFSNPADKMWAIEVNGTRINGGAIGMTMGNDSWKANQRAKAVHISELLGIQPADEHLADKIWDEVVPGLVTPNA